MTELPSMDEVREQILEVLTETTERRAHMRGAGRRVYPHLHWKFWPTKVLQRGWSNGITSTIVTSGNGFTASWRINGPRLPCSEVP